MLKLEPIAARSAGFPQVTSLLCQNAGGIFVPLPRADAGEGDLALRLLEITEEVGQLARDLRNALDDGALDASEIATMRADLGALLQSALAYDERLKEIGPAETPARATPEPSPRAPSAPAARSIG